MATVGMPNLTDYRARLEVIQEQLIPGSISQRYQLEGTPVYPNWRNTIRVTPASQRSHNARILLITVQMFLARGKVSDSAFPRLAEDIDADIPMVLAYFLEDNNPFIVGDFTTNQPGFVRQPVSIEAVSPATYDTQGNADDLGSAYTLTFSHSVVFDR